MATRVVAEVPVDYVKVRVLRADASRLYVVSPEVEGQTTTVLVWTAPSGPLQLVPGVSSLALQLVHEDLGECLVSKDWLSDWQLCAAATERASWQWARLLSSVGGRPTKASATDPSTPGPRIEHGLGATGDDAKGSIDLTGQVPVVAGLDAALRQVVLAALLDVESDGGEDAPDDRASLCDLCEVPDEWLLGTGAARSVLDFAKPLAGVHFTVELLAALQYHSRRHSDPCERAEMCLVLRNFVSFAYNAAPPPPAEKEEEKKKRETAAEDAPGQDATARPVSAAPAAFAPRVLLRLLQDPKLSERPLALRRAVAQEIIASDFKTLVARDVEHDAVSLVASCSLSDIRVGLSYLRGCFPPDRAGTLALAIAARVAQEYPDRDVGPLARDYLTRSLGALQVSL